LSSLENLINKIISDGNAKAQAALDDANLKRGEILKAAQAKAGEILQSGRVNADLEAKNKKAQYLLEQDINLRDRLLTKKQEVLDKIFNKAIEKLSNLPIEEYEAFLKKYLLALDINGFEEILIPEKYEGLNKNAINDFLKQSGKKGGLTFTSDKRKIKNGFIVLRGGIENDNTFESLINYFKDDMEIDIIKIIEQ
jgi:V/A-type H+-transporting ATPase subunit E